MSNIQIDADALTAALAQALPVAIKAAIDAAVVSPSTPTVVNASKPKRGRPKKSPQQPVRENTEIITDAPDVGEILNDASPARQPTAGYVVKAQAYNKTRVVGNACGAQSVAVKRGEQKFIDIASVPHEKQEWTPTERRQPVEKMEFECASCRRKFKAYASEYPQAFMRSRLETGEEDIPLVYCDTCVIGRR